MRLSRMILVNWGTLPDRTFEFTGTTALTGETGAGKTSVIDAMVTVMTGGSSNLGKLNSASDDGKGERKRDAIYRSIEGYILGGHNKLFARETAYGYVAMVFEPEASEASVARTFTAVLAAAAVLRKNTLGAGNVVRNADLQDVIYLVADGIGLSMKDFLVSDAGGLNEVVPVEAIVKHLKEMYPGRQTRSEITSYRKDQHADYLRRLYGALEGRGESSLERAKAQATIWSRFISQEKIDNIGQFVRDFVLPAPTDFAELQKISDGVRASKRLNEQAKLVIERLTHLEASLQAGEAFGRQAIVAKSLECAAFRRAYNDANEASRRAGLSAKEFARKRSDAAEGVRSLEATIEALTLQQAEIIAKLLGISSYQRDQDLRAARGLKELALVSAFERAKLKASYLAALAELLPSLELPGDVSIAHKELTALLERARAVAPPRTDLDNLVTACEGLNPNSRSASFPAALTQASLPVEEAVDRMLDVLDGEERSLNTAALAALAVVNTQLENAQRLIADKKADLSRIEHGNSVSYPGSTRSTLEYLRARLPEGEATVLCDLITQVRDEAWQNAIEGYIGNSRFGILVKPDFQPEADVLLEARRMEGKANAALIQGALALKENRDSGSRLSPDSIVHELVVDNPYAKAYLERQYGSVIKVKNARDLHKVRNGLTQDGRGSGSYRTFDAYADDGDLTFGKRARERRKESRLAEIAALNVRVENLHRQLKSILALSRLQKLSDPLRGERIHQLCAQAESSLAEMSRLTAQIEALDLTDAKDLQGLQAKVIEQSNAEGKTRDAKIAEEARHGKDVEMYEKIQRSQAELAVGFESERETATRELLVLGAQAPWVDFATLQEEADAKAYDPAQSVKGLQEEKAQALIDLAKGLAKFQHQLGKYNEIAATVEDAIASGELFAHAAQSPGMFTAVSKIVARARDVERSLRNSQLARLNVEIDTTSRNLRSTFSTHFCNRILKELEHGEATVRTLNAELQFQTFGRDKYRFKTDWNTDAYRNRQAFFMRIREKTADETFDMFAEGALEGHDIAIRDEIMALFLAAAEEGGKAALMQVADYRQYRRYDLLKVMTVAGEEHESSITTQLTDSGGEKETGLFVARVATLTGGLGLREPGPHLRTVVIDELFKKTDESRIRAALEYLMKTRELHVVFAMPTRSIGPFKDIIDAEYAITRMQSDSLVGQLDHFVIIEHHVYNPQAVAELRERKRLAVRTQAEIQFNEMERAEAAA